MHPSATGLHGTHGVRSFGGKTDMTGGGGVGGIGGDGVLSIVTAGVNLASTITGAVTQGKQAKWSAMQALQESATAERITALQLAQAREQTLQAAYQAQAAAAQASSGSPLPWIIGGFALVGGLGVLLLGRKRR